MSRRYPGIHGPLGARQEAPPQDTLELADVLPRLPRLYCGTCTGKVRLEWPTFLPGHLYCLDCGKQYNAVVKVRAS